jgi:hypothetical protein
MSAVHLGLTKFQYKSASLLPYTVVLLLSLIQLRNFAPTKPSTATPVEVKKTKFVKFISRSDRSFKKFIIILKRFCIMHQPKLLLIFLIVAAQTNLTMVGVGYFVFILLYVPIPIVSIYMWPLISVYASVIVLAEYIYQFPYFVSYLHCDASSKPDSSCPWLIWAGFQLAPSGTVVGSVLWAHLLVFTLAMTQRAFNRWRVEMIRDETYTPGVLINNFEFKSEKETFWKICWRYTLQATQFLLNHFFDEFGYDITLLMLLIAAMIFLQVSILLGILFITL